uniref:Uncharacterized protein n=1 Tax=Arundo donax TaxID=35708 RepID=A0A0A9BXW7_ARUDO
MMITYWLLRPMCYS